MRCQMKENFVQILVVVVEVSVDLRFSKYWELNIPFLGCTTAYRHQNLHKIPFHLTPHSSFYSVVQSFFDNKGVCCHAL